MRAYTLGPKDWGASGKQPEIPPKTVTMPVEEGLVTVGVDGHDVDLLLDSGYYGLDVFDGHWYEETFGRGSCKKRGAACYFCPENAPCNFGKTESVSTLTFASGKTVQTINRSGSLALGGHIVSGITFSVCRVSDVNNYAKPLGHFGISMMPEISEHFQLPPNMKSLMELLMHRNLVGRLSYTLRTNTTQRSTFTSGEITFGDTIDGAEAAKYIHPEFIRSPKSQRAFPTVWVSSVNLLGADDHFLRTQGFPLAHGNSYMTIADTGADGIYLPQPGLINGIIKKLRKGLKQKGYTNERMHRMWWRGAGFLHVREEALSSLPVLEFRLATSTRLKIRPKHYCTDKGNGTSRLGIRERKFPTLGTPLFRAYSIHVDYTERTIALLENQP
ncbi:hypothetical protein FOZ62_000012 [Perkinsus olseni]|uniref:Peptidase A1 domain-containing protein n=1 Tax=Perkinsus olseni TaxID=32597 RepID=A0A7J6UHQ9_PEROL|nr:hypothetical protein FOZ62_000012 [Perkinsus olseni]